MAHVERLVDEVDAVAVEDVEEPHEQARRRARGAVAAEGAHGVLERLGGGVLVHAEHLAVEHHGRHREVARQRHHAGEPVGDVVEVAGVDAHVVVEPVHLHARAVELPLDGGEAGVPERLGDVGRARRQHRLDRVQHREPHGVEGVLPFGQRERRGATEVTREHRGAPDDGDRDAGGGGDGVGHHAGQRALPQLAGQQPADEVDLGLGGAREEVGEQPLASRLGSRAGRPGQLGEDPVHLEDLDRGLVGRLDVLPVGGSPADADAALASGAGEEPDRHLDLVGIERAQERGERLHLRLPRPGGADGSGRLDERGQQHPPMLPSSLAGWAAARRYDAPSAARGACERVSDVRGAGRP